MKTETSKQLTDDEAADIFEAGDDFAPADSAPTDSIVAAVAERDRAQDRIDEAVRAARDAKVTWSEIGRALGVSHQAAIKRYGRG